MKNFTQDEAKVIYNDAKSKGLDPDVVMSKLVMQGVTFDGVDMQQARQFAETKVPQAQTTFGERAKETIMEGRQAVQDINSSDASLGTKIAQNAAQVTGLPLKIAFDALPKPAREGLQFVGDAISKGFKVGVDKLADTKLFTEIGNLEAQGFINPQTAPEFYKLKDALAGTAAAGETAANLTGLEQSVTGASKLASKAASTAAAGVDALASGTKSALDVVNEGTSSLGDTLAKRKIDLQTQTILKETPASKLEEYIKQGQDAITDPRVNTPLQNAGLQAEEVAKTIKADLNNIGADKAALLETVGKTRVPNIAVQQIEKVKPFLQKKLTTAERSLVNSYLEELTALGKNPTAASVDATIDKLQATLYELKGGTAIPTTTRVQSFINKSIGELNSTLKSTVDNALGDNAYSKLNAQYAGKIDIFNQLNKVLGEGGNKGGSVMKRFFSPQDAGIKNLFQKIRGQYGVDLGQEATLAKFVMDTLGDTRASSLLELPPTSPSGLLSRGVDIIEKQLTKPEKVFNAAKKITSPAQSLKVKGTIPEK